MPKNEYDFAGSVKFHKSDVDRVYEQMEIFQGKNIVVEWKVSKLMSTEQIQQTKNDLNTERGKQPYWL